MGTKLKEWAFAPLTAACICGILGARANQLIYHPEWTESMALREQWPVYLISITTGMAAIAILHYHGKKSYGITKQTDD